METVPVATNVKGLPTGTWNRIVTSTNQTLNELTTTFYDTKGRSIRSITSNSQLGGYTQTDSKLNFDGSQQYTIRRHKRTNSGTEPELVTRDDYAYTAQDRLLYHTHTINDRTPQLMSYNAYNSLGQLIQKKVGNTQASPLQIVDFAYNIRGWLKSINDVSSLGSWGRGNVQDLFAFKINYTDQPALIGNPLYNGNIAETTWRTASDNIKRSYSYKYDEINRLRDAYYQIPDATVPMRNSYDESLKYDGRGNITTLKRNGGIDSENAVPIDDLTYTYTGNRLDKVVDNLENSPQGFNDTTPPTVNDFTYDEFGNLTSDLNKGIAADGIVYNHLNLPLFITINNGLTKGTIAYLYNAAGVKLRKRVTNTSRSPTVVTTTDYLNGYQYTNTVLDFFPTSEGYVKNTVIAGVNTYNYVYQYKDHLGNVRLSYTVDPADNEVKIMEESHYYPFGLKHQGYSNDQNMLAPVTIPGFPAPLPVPVTLIPVVNPGDVTYKYKYNGKELQDELGLNMYDYGARNYDPALGRWMNIDPLAETSRRWSPYTYAYNNPVYFIDPDGMMAEHVTITGADADKATKELDKSSSLKITRDKDSGRLSAKGEAKTEYDKTLLSAINDENVNVNLKTVTSEKIAVDGVVGEIAVGSYAGSRKTGDGKVEATQFVNMNHTKKVEDAGVAKQGNLVGHEVNESYIAAQENGGINRANSASGDAAYLKGHNEALRIDGSVTEPTLELMPDGGKFLTYPKPDGSLKAVKLN